MTDAHKHATEPIDDRSFIELFEACALPFDQWCHRWHIRIAYLYLSQLSFELALERIRSGIQDYNVASGAKPGPEGGYHETVTVAWCHLARSELERVGRQESSDAFCDACPSLLDKDHLLEFYSRERLESPEAAREYLEPDLKPLPGERSS